ncbi:MAG: ABC transporter substrate-binding protein [Chloroflexota bacterium]
MSFKRIFWMASALMALAVLAACQPQVVEVEVTRVVTETEEVEVVVTEIVEVEGETVVEEVEVEVTVVVEATEVPDPQGGEVVSSSFADINTLNPVLGNDNASSTNYGLMFDAMATLDPFSGAVVPNFASWETSDDGLEVTFTINDGVSWSDGTPITANDIAFTFDAINTEDVASPRRSNFASVTDWVVVDDSTLTMSLSSVDCSVPANVYTQGLIPAHVYDNDPTTIPDNPENLNPTVVSGPFQFGEWAPDDFVRLDANPDYWDGAPNVDSWIYKVYADQSAEFAGLLAGEIDYTGVGPGFVSVVEGRIASGEDLNIRKFFSNGYTFVGYNLANPENPQNGWDDLDEDGTFTDGEPPLAQDPHPVLGNLEVRQAMAYSIDYTGIINKVAFGQGGPTVANVWPSIGWAYNNDIEPYAQDLELAAQILTDGGWAASSNTNDADVAILEKDGQPLEINLMTNAGNETRENIGILMKDTLDELGFDVTLEFIEFGTVVEKLLGQTYDVVIIGFGGGAPDPDDTSQFSYTTDEVGAGFNFVSYYNETVESNLASGKAVPGCVEAERAPFYISNQEEIYNDVPYNFLYIPLANTVWRDRLLNIDPNPWNGTYNIQDWALSAE